ncbi:protein kinase domain protein [Ichthyophthirius multifiliis]|uniref:Protein kinase domain protein n=1 Tax=Ichthyophthirius multifiliis TaxID=5932 RepID=G0QXI3_ICHMU|nr:protein kinase domain protein [Ichthyophthirius multifiliis]EGR30075.1 protein kinase domain protein [Ichthyophthirius multifiliis]|eukprot:XP_004031311.1 protein kinase domain protein [Ichthyophthirius multifiliis]
MEIEQDKLDVSKISNYKLVDQKYYIKNHVLGRGNFAETYLATLKENENQILACKLISKDSLMEKLRKSKEPESRKKYIIDSLKNEVQVWKKLNHPNIVQFIDFSETYNNIYFFLEYCNGKDLQKCLKEKTRLSEEESLIISQQIANGCQYLYQKAIFHRDLKPENILIHNGIAKIADFGFSKAINYDMRDTANSGTSVGTPYYMSPQIILGQDYSIKCDVWSLGVMYYETLYGMVPFQDKNSIESLAQKIQQGNIQYPAFVKISNDLKELLQKMLTVEEEKRISMTEVKNKIDELVDRIKK